MSSPAPSSSDQPSRKPFSIALSSSRPSSAHQSGSSTPSISLPRRSNLPPSKPTTPRPRFQDHDSDGSDAENHKPTHEEVTGFDQSAGGAISRHVRETKEKEPLVIRVDGRNGWRERLFGSARAKKSWLPEEVRAQREANGPGRTEDAAAVEVEGPSTKFGLSYATEPRTAEQNGSAEGVASTTATEPRGNGNAMEVDTVVVAERKELSQDEAALQALIRESKGEVDHKSDLVITSQGGSAGVDNGYDETRSFRNDVSRRPDPASLADYAAIPVEQFGAALLRGMGWKEGQPVGRGRYESTSSSQQNGSLAPRIPERRPGYLGIGAKDLSGKAGSAELELGAWGKAAMRKSKPGEGLYTPVLMKNKKTGEMITEDEFKKLSKEQEKDKEKRSKGDEWKERRDKNLQKSGRRYDFNDEQRGSRESSSRRNEHGRSRSSSAGRDRDRYRDSRRERKYKDDYDDRDGDDYDSERRRRDERRYRDRDYERGSESGGRRDKDRDRDRDRRDRNRDRERHKHREELSDRDRDRRERHR